MTDERKFKLLFVSVRDVNDRGGLVENWNNGNWSVNGYKVISNRNIPIKFSKWIRVNSNLNSVELVIFVLGKLVLYY